jgi:hypothetical protein
MTNDKVHIVLVDWNGYKLRRTKYLGENTIKCGLGPLLKRIDKYESGVDFEISLIINFTERFSFKNKLRNFLSEKSALPKSKYQSLKGKYPFIKNIYFRDENVGMDLGAYNFGLEKIIKENFEGDVIFMNSSVIGPQKNNWLREYKKLFHEFPNIGLCGITANSHATVTNETKSQFMPHVQSFFLYTKTELLKKVFSNKLPGSDLADDKIKLIMEGEIGISQNFLLAGYAIRTSAFPDFVYKVGDDWVIPEGELRFNKKYRKIANRMNIAF